MNKARLLFLTACLALLAASCAINIKRYSALMPEGMRDCALCHVMDEKGRPAERGRLLAVTVEDMCANCHDSRLEEGEHPVGMPLAPEVSWDRSMLPLYDGKVECPTCHEPHGLDGNHAMLRQPLEAICLSCHDF